MYCKRCGARLQQGTPVCPECGTRQRTGTTTIRCAHCHRRASVELRVCPHCGRDLRPAGPRWGLWLGGLVILALASLWALGGLPLERAQEQIATVKSRAAALAQIVQLPTPLPAPSATPASRPTLASIAALASSEPVSSPTAASSATPSASATPIASPAATASVAPGTATPATQTPAPSGTPSSAPTPAPTPTAAPTATLTPTPTPTSQPPSPTATQAPAVAVAGRSHRVQPGDTLYDIGLLYGVPWEAIAAANGITADTALQVGQELVIPSGNVPIPPTATPRPRPTATPVAPTPTPAPTLPAPELRDPGDGSKFNGEKALVELTWSPVPGMPAGAQYLVTITWTEGGAAQSYSLPPTTATVVRMPLWLWGKADQPDRRYLWSVTVVQVASDGKGGQRIIALSPPSALRRLIWD